MKQGLFCSGGSLSVLRLLSVHYYYFIVFPPKWRALYNNNNTRNNNNKNEEGALKKREKNKVYDKGREPMHDQNPTENGSEFTNIANNIFRIFSQDFVNLKVT